MEKRFGRACSRRGEKKKFAPIERDSFTGFAGEDHAVEGFGERFARGIGAGNVGARADAELREFGDEPIFAIGSIPELDGVFGGKIGLGDFVGMEEPFAGYASVADGEWPETMEHYVIGMQAEKKIWVDGVVEDLLLLFGGEAGKIGPTELAIKAHGLRGAAKFHGAADVGRMGRGVFATEIVADATEQRMEDGAVEALVVVEDDKFPIGLDVVVNAMDEAEVLHLPWREFLR